MKCKGCKKNFHPVYNGQEYCDTCHTGNNEYKLLCKVDLDKTRGEEELDDPYSERLRDGFRLMGGDDE